MNKNRFFSFGAVVLLTLFSWAFAVPDQIGLCPKATEDGWHQCVLMYGTVGWPFALIFSGVTLSFLLYLFVQPSIFKPWKILTFIYVPVAILLTLLAPQTSGILDPDSEVVSLWLSILYVLISVILIAYKSWKIKTSGEGL